MQYKTIVLELLQQYPQRHEQLRRQRRLLPTMNGYAAELRRQHHAWMDVLRPARPESDPSQIASEALELALQDLKDALRHEFSNDETETFPIEEAMASLRRHTPPA